jgi:hypothetical protein
MGCMCNKNKTNNQEQKQNGIEENIEQIKDVPINNISNNKSQENNINKNYKKENFIDLNNFLSKYWIYIVIITLILIVFLYYVFLNSSRS